MDRQGRLTVSTEPLADGRMLIVARGALDLFSAPRLKAALDDALDDGAARLLVDLCAVTALDSSGLAALVGAHKRARTTGQEIAVVANPEVTRRFRMTGLDTVFPVSTRREEPALNRRPSSRARRS